jgi:hypothetical protein
MIKKDFSMATIIALVASLLTVFGVATPASAAVTLPATTSWTNAGLQEMVRLTGRLKTSIDGFGSSTGSGLIQVEKPSANAKVVAAFVTLVGTAGTGNLATPSDVTLGGQAISFSHTANVTAQSTAFKNFFSDVTTLVKPTVDAAGSGILDFAVDEGAGQVNYDGLSLIVVFDDPSTVWSSVVIAFGASKSAGDSFSLGFPALNANELSGHRLSVGIGFGYQTTNGAQSSTIDITTSSVASASRIAEYAGSFDDGAAANGALITVGGVGDSNANPIIGATFSNPADDELYNLSGLLNVGDTELTITTRNASGDDNLFQAVFFINRVAVSGATTISDPVVDASIGAPSQNRNAPNTDTDLPPGSTSSPAPAQSSPSTPSTPRPASSTYEGPEIREFSSRNLYPGDVLILGGRKLNEIKTLTARGVTLSFSVIDGGRLSLRIPMNFPLGPVDFEMTSDFGTLKHLAAVTVSQKPKGQELNILSPSKNVNSSFVKMLQRRLDRVQTPFNKVLCIVNTPDQQLSNKVAQDFCAQLVTGKRAGAELVTEIRYNADFTRGFWARVFLGWQK